MIDLHSWNTSNGRKVSIILEELNLPYRFHPVDITNGEQFNPKFLAISPNNKIPVIVDQDGIDGSVTVFESGAILMYLAAKTGSELFPEKLEHRLEVLQWLMWQKGSVGPMFGQALHFLKYAPEIYSYAIKRYSNEVKRLFSVLDKRLAEHEFIVDYYSIADIAVFPWVLRYDWLEIDLTVYSNVTRWFNVIYTRPAVQRGLIVQDIDHPGNKFSRVA